MKKMKEIKNIIIYYMIIIVILQIKIIEIKIYYKILIQYFRVKISYLHQKKNNNYMMSNSIIKNINMNVSMNMIITKMKI